MRMEKKRVPGFKPLVTSLTIVGLLIALAWCLQPASAQNPGLTGTKASSPLPASNASLVPSKPAEYKVAIGQIIKEIVLTGELKAERSIEISAPNIRRRDPSLKRENASSNLTMLRF
jgi:hypothetical protein